MPATVRPNCCAHSLMWSCASQVGPIRQQNVCVKPALFFHCQNPTMAVDRTSFELVTNKLQVTYSQSNSVAECSPNLFVLNLDAADIQRCQLGEWGCLQVDLVGLTLVTVVNNRHLHRLAGVRTGLPGGGKIWGMASQDRVRLATSCRPGRKCTPSWL